MRSCVTNQKLPGSGLNFDHRYFYLDSSGRARYTCGLARQAMMELFREVAEESYFLGLEWQKTIRTLRDNPSAVGFIIEAVVISTISTRGLTFDTCRIHPTKITSFRDDFPLIERHASAFYVPLRFNFRAIDALYVDIDSSAGTAHIIAIQITVAKQQTDSEGAFFPNWRLWSQNLSHLKLKWTFLWILPRQREQQDVEAKKLNLRKGPVTINPEYSRNFVSLDQVDLELSDVYEEISTT